MNRKSILLLALWALLAVLTFNPYGAFLGTLTYKYVPDDEAVPDTVLRLRLQTAGTMTVLGGGNDGQERKLAKGTRLEVLGTCQYSGASYSPTAQVEGRKYLVQLADSTRGFMELPQMADHSFFQKQERMLVYLFPGGRRSASNAIRLNDEWLDSHKGTKMGVFAWAGYVLRSINRVPLRIFKAVSSQSAEGGHYFLYPRFSAWNVYDLPAFCRGRVFRNVWDFLCSVIFFMSAHLLARGLTRKNGEASALYYPLAVLITLLGVTSIVAWIFFFLGIFVRRSLTGYHEMVRCPKCHKTTLETYRRESIQHNSHLVEHTRIFNGGSYKYYTYHSHLEFFDYDRCTHCGYVVPRHKSSEYDNTETMDMTIDTQEKAWAEFDRLDGKLKVHWDNSNEN